MIPTGRLVLVRGLPGSGKSTIAKSIAINGYTHLETDMYWGPDYNFDISKIKEAHQWCQDTTKYLLNKGGFVVVSNTFTTAWELLPYFDIAKEFQISPQVILCQGQYGTIHPVPTEVILKMSGRFEYDISHLWLRLKNE